MKKDVLKLSQNLQENNCVRVFFNKVASLRLQLFEKRGSITSVSAANFVKF